MGTKQRNKFTNEQVASADELLEVGHEQFAAAGYSHFSKAVNTSANPFARAAPVAVVGKDEDNPEEESRRNKKGSSPSRGIFTFV
eukprot:918793-Heterocapsa_arctica.AAC.1